GLPDTSRPEDTPTMNSESGHLEEPGPHASRALIVGAVACFITGRAHEAFIAITIQEICIVLFFILIYLVSLQHLLICLHWPLLDLINSIISTIFLLVVAVLTIQEKGRRQLYYIGGSLCVGAAILCCIDALLVIKVIRNKMKEEQAAKETLQSSLH
uniref:MARVEL domain-containing protein n=1 Tax=Castor canadensis TaxID=51338 RepID=A0A8C0ZTD4_CASCN